jgi:prepilin-type N-terminal cleavage/methylation domain-containing protein
MKQKNKIENLDVAAGSEAVLPGRDVFTGNKKNSQGFTLLEILLVVAIIAILAIIVIFAINPGRQMAQARNSQRKVAVNTIMNAVYQYSIDNQGVLPANIPLVDSTACLDYSDGEICKTGYTDTCDVDFSALTQDERFLVAIPEDPSGAAYKVNGSGYSIQINSNNRITVCAANAELDEAISLSR